MNFYNDEENEKKAGAPALPRAASPFKKTSAFGKSPLFSRAAGGIMDRLKNLSRRDMALVGLGLSVLTMVPVAEYMMSQPSQDNVLSGGWGGKEKLGDMPYEPGINSLSQGSADGSGEVITPLSSRDPMSLILGSQSAQPAAAAPVYTPPASNMRDAMRDAGREAFSAAAKSAGAPTVIPKMAAGLRGMSSFFGGGESSRTQGSLGGGKIIDDARSASSKSAKRSMVGPVAMAGYKGVASTPNSASKGAFEKLRAAADKSAGNFSGGSAMRSLDKAAADALEIGKGAGGMGAGGDSDKTGKTSGNTVKGYEHSRSGESLAEMAAKQRMQKALEWEFFKKYEIKKQIINAIMGAVTGVMGEFIKGNLTTALGMDPPRPAKCYTTVRETPDWPAAEAAVANNTVKSTLEYVCKADGGPIVVSYQMGKEAATSLQKKCICDAFAGSTTSPAPGANPGANPGGTPDSIVPGTTPDQISATTGATISEYDKVLIDIMIPAVQAYHKLAKKSVDGEMQPKAVDKEDETEVTAALNDAFAKLDLAASNAVANAMRAKNGAVRTSFNTYGTDVEKMVDAVAASPASKNLGYISALEAAAKAGSAEGQRCTVKMNPQYKPEGVAAVENNANCAAIVKTIKESQSLESARGNFKLASEALQAHRNRKSAFGQQLPVMDGAVGAVIGEHNKLPAEVKAILEGEGTMLAKIEKITDKDDIPSAPEDPAQKNARQAQTKPLNKAVVDLRGVTMASLWEKKLNGSAAVQSEMNVWGPFDVAAAKGAATLGAPNNFEAGLFRPNEMQTSIGGATKGLADITGLLATAGTSAKDAVTELKALAAACNFTDAGCTATTTPTTDTPPANTGGNGVSGTAGGGTPDPKPNSNPDPKPAVDPQAEAKKTDAATAKVHRLSIDACYNSTSGFKEGQSVRCSLQRADRVNGIATLIGRYETHAGTADTQAERTLYLGYMSDERSTAYTWADSCLANVPAACTR